MTLPNSTRNVVTRLDAALHLVRHDRWQLTAVAGTELEILAAGPRATLASERRRRRAGERIEAGPLARRAIAELRTVVVSTIRVLPDQDEEEEWERDWATIVYAPVFRGRRKAVGLLAVGCRQAVWYEDPDVDYIGSLARSVFDFVLQSSDPFRDLTRLERTVAYLLADGCSGSEVAQALDVAEAVAQRTVDSILSKLDIRSAKEVRRLVDRRQPPPISA